MRRDPYARLVRIEADARAGKFKSHKKLPPVTKKRDVVDVTPDLIEDLTRCARGGHTATEAATRAGWRTVVAMQRALHRHGQHELWAKLRENSHAQGVTAAGTLAARNNLNAGKREGRKATI